MNKKMKNSPKIFVCFVTCGKIVQAKKIANALVNNKLAACVNIVKGVESIYRWKNKICRDRENLLIIKGNFRNKSKLIAKIQSLHSYEVPEIIFLEIKSGSKKYLEWIDSVTK